MNITADVPLKLRNNPDSTDLSETVKEYTVPSRQDVDGVRVPVSPVTLVDATINPIRQYSAFSWDSRPVLTGVTADPAAGAQIPDIVVPAGKRWRIQSVFFQVVNAAAAANRFSTVYMLSDAANIYAFPAAPAAAIISETVYYSYGKGCTMYNTTTGTVTTNTSGVDGFVLEAGGIMRLFYININAGDNLTVARYTYKEASA